jgi:hypothetical protein
VRADELCGEDFSDDLDDVPLYFIRFDTERDLKRWWEAHRDQRYGPPRWRESGCYAAYMEMECCMGSTVGTVLDLKPPLDGLQTLRLIRDHMNAQAEELADLEAEELVHAIADGLPK